jgi:hypothetical protein
MEPTFLVLKVRIQSLLVEQLYHIDKLLNHSLYPDYVWIPEYFIGNKRPKVTIVVEKLKTLGWKITSQCMNEKILLITMEKINSL